MTTFKHAGNPDFPVYNPRTGATLRFEGGSYETTDQAEIALLRTIDGVTEEQTKAELLEQAKGLEIEGAAKMKKDELEQAVADAQPAAPAGT